MRAVSLWALGGLALASATQAEAASFDCGKAATQIEKLICADPRLSALDDKLAAAYKRAIAASLDPQSLRQGQRDWLGEIRKKGAGEAALRTAYENRIAELETRAREAAATPREVSLAETQSRCVPVASDVVDAECAVLEFGAVDGASPRPLRYQRQEYKDGDLRMGGGVVVLEVAGGGRARPIAAIAEEGAYFGRPVLVASPAGTLLHIPGHLAGTGNYNSERLFRRDEERWRDVDTTSWLRDLDRRLPKGLGVWKGLYPNYAAMRATTPLWREKDANCCPSGGTAEIRIALRGDRIVLEDVRVRRGEKAEAAPGADAEICGKHIDLALDEESFASAGDTSLEHQTGRETAARRGPALVAEAMNALCAKGEVDPALFRKRVDHVQIAWAAAATEIAAYFPEAPAAPRTLAVQYLWSGRELPSGADLRAGLRCAFTPTTKSCRDRAP